MSNYYQILGVSETATAEEIKSAYRRKAKQYHPDMHENDPYYEERFKLVNEAYANLSNAYKRSVYDNQQTYQHYRPSTQGSRRRPFRPPPPPHMRKRAKEYGYDLAQEKKSSLYAFIFVAIVSVLVLTINTIYEYAQELKLENAKTQIMTSMILADSLFYAGDIRAAVEEIRQTRLAMESEHYVIDFLGEMVKKNEILADSYYADSRYDSALFSYLLVYEYNNYQSMDFFYNVAICYKEMGKTGQAIVILDEIMVKDNYNIRYINEIAAIYEGIEQDADMALRYYQMGVDVIIDKFVGTYGEAYRLLVSRERTPGFYYDTFYGAGRTAFRLGKFEQSSKALEWAVFIKPNLAAPRLMLAKAYYHMGKNHESCKNYRQAKLVDHDLSDPGLETYCK